MKLQLTKLKHLELLETTSIVKPRMEGYRRLKVNYCAVCKTDAKMWNEGHRDLIFPRVLGHEISAEDSDGIRYAVWPGAVCNTCEYCQSGRYNLCEKMKIMGFHHDGGFADTVMAPQESLIPIADDIPTHLICFTEPIGCVINICEKVRIKTGDRVIIYGGGTLGMITALMCRETGARPVVIEKDERKIKKARNFTALTDIPVTKETTKSDFDVAVNACPDPIAFALAISKLKKGGRLGFFSGLKKNQNIDSGLFNLVHYKELIVSGSYGLTKQNMIAALPILDRHADIFDHLVEAVIQPDDVEDVLNSVLFGRALRYIIDFTATNAANVKPLKIKASTPQKHDKFQQKTTPVTDLFHQTTADVTPVSKALSADIQFKIDNKTKPLGALGKLEQLAVQAALVQNDLFPDIKRKLMLVFGADHGITEEGVSAYPSEVTFQMVENFLNGGAAINVLCQNYNIDLNIVDMGVKGDFKDHPILFTRKIAKGTKNFAVEPAMSESDAYLAVETGMKLFMDQNRTKKIDLLGVGEIGIGNTTSAAAIISAVTGVPPLKTAGRGTGLDDKGLKHKIEVLERALTFHNPDGKDGLAVLHTVGGFEIAGIVGAVLAAAAQKTIVVLDGVISTAAGLIAYLIHPNIKDYLVAGHKSIEIAQQAALEFMGLEPVIDLEMRLGEGTGAAMTMNLIETACAIMRDMASFDEAGVSTRKT